MENVDPNNDTIIWVFVLFMTTCIAGILLMGARFLGAELRVTNDADAVGGPNPKRQWIQFSLRSLISWTTALALLLGSLHYLPGEQLRQILFSDSQSIAILGVILSGSALIAFAAIWITLGTRWLPARYFVLALAGAAAILWMYLVLGPNELETLLPFCLGQVGWMVGSLWLVRLAGYRLIWRRRVRL